MEVEMKIRILIVEEDEIIVESMKKIIKKSIPLANILSCPNADIAKRKLISDKEIKFLITTYTMKGFGTDRLDDLAYYIKEVRPDVRQMGIGSFHKSELILGHHKLLLIDERELQLGSIGLVYPGVTPIDKHKQDDGVISWAYMTSYPYNI